ncbi:MAG: hypothetical protein ACRDT0_10155, partial [Pseudonocardiaceae bacterium]
MALYELLHVVDCPAYRCQASSQCLEIERLLYLLCAISTISFATCPSREGLPPVVRTYDWARPASRSRASAWA